MAFEARVGPPLYFTVVSGFCPHVVPLCGRAVAGASRINSGPQRVSLRPVVSLRWIRASLSGADLGKFASRICFGLGAARSNWQKSTCKKTTTTSSTTTNTQSQSQSQKRKHNQKRHGQQLGHESSLSIHYCAIDTVAFQSARPAACDSGCECRRVRLASRIARFLRLARNRGRNLGSLAG